MNRVDLTGRITKDPEVKVTQQSNTSICVFSIACRRSYKNSKGEYDTDFIRCVAFGKTAEFIEKYFVSQVLILWLLHSYGLPRRSYRHRPTSRQPLQSSSYRLPHRQPEPCRYNT